MIIMNKRLLIDVIVCVVLFCYIDNNVHCSRLNWLLNQYHLEQEDRFKPGYIPLPEHKYKCKYTIDGNVFCTVPRLRKISNKKNEIDLENLPSKLGKYKIQDPDVDEVYVDDVPFPELVPFCDWRPSGDLQCFRYTLPHFDMSSFNDDPMDFYEKIFKSARSGRRTKVTDSDELPLPNPIPERDLDCKLNSNGDIECTSSKTLRSFQGTSIQV